MYDRLRKAIVRAVRLRCPRCGVGALFRGAFAMHERCPRCHLVFEREPGYFIGAIYINYAVTVMLAIAGFLLLEDTGLSVGTQIGIWCAFGVVFPLWFFRYSKSLWMAIGYFVSPEAPALRRLDRHRA
jgi:uncharacterized protein (DUF983 family)